MINPGMSFIQFSQSATQIPAIKQISFASNVVAKNLDTRNRKIIDYLLLNMPERLFPEQAQYFVETEYLLI